MNRIAFAGAVFLSFVMIAWAGCVSGGGGVLSKADAPEGPRSLRVGSTTADEYYRIAMNTTGHGIKYDFQGRDVKETLETVSDHTYLERKVSNESTKDAFLRPFDGVRYGYRFTDLDPEKGDVPVYTYAPIYELASRKFVYSDVHTAFTSYSCDQSGCTADTKEVDYRFYSRVAEPADNHSLAGRVLTLGKKISFDNSFFDSQGNQYVYYQNYTPKREVTLAGERTFLVEAGYGFEVRYKVPPPTAGSTPQPSSTEDAGPKLPKAVHTLYLSSRSPVPVKEINNSPFIYNKAVYWRNTTSTLEMYTPGAGIVPWGSGAPLANVTAKPGVPVGPIADLLKENSLPIKLTPAQAWTNLRSDPTLVTFQGELKKSADLVPLQATYFVDNAHNTYTWSFLTGVGGPKVQADARLSAAPVPGVMVPQQREQALNYRSSQLPTDDVLAAAKVTSLKDAYDSFRTVHPTGAEPAIMIRFYMQGGSTPTLHGDAVFGYPLPWVSYSGGIGPIAVPPAREMYLGGESVGISLTDGGLTGFNNSYLSVRNEWPWLPNSLPIYGDAAQLAEKGGFLEEWARRWV